MKATELRIGDWVAFADLPVKVKEVKQDGVCVDLSCFDNSKGEQGYAAFEDLSPTPLTKEILEKNGWRKDADATLWVLGYLGLYWFMVDGYYELCYADGCMKPIAQTRVEYVHQLQHLLWALGIGDDLKI